MADPLDFDLEDALINGDGLQEFPTDLGLPELSEQEKRQITEMHRTEVNTVLRSQFGLD